MLFYLSLTWANAQQVVGKELEELVDISRNGTTVILDEVGKVFAAFLRKLSESHTCSSTLGTTTVKAKKAFLTLLLAMLKT